MIGEVNHSFFKSHDIFVLIFTMDEVKSGFSAPYHAYLLCVVGNIITTNYVTFKSISLALTV